MSEFLSEPQGSPGGGPGLPFATPYIEIDVSAGGTLIASGPQAAAGTIKATGTPPGPWSLVFPTTLNVVRTLRNLSGQPGTMLTTDPGSVGFAIADTVHKTFTIETLPSAVIDTVLLT